MEDFFGHLEPDLRKVPHIAMTDMLCGNAACPAGKPRERLADAGGLYLEVQPAGGKHWRLPYRFAGKEKRRSLGTDPTVTLARARPARCDVPRRTRAEGIDPVQAKTDLLFPGGATTRS